MALPPDADLSVYAFRLTPPCGRVFLLPLERIRDDYVAFLVDAEGLSEKEALARVGPDDVETWFFEQFEWSDVDRLGVCIHQTTDQEFLSCQQAQDFFNHIRLSETPSYSSCLTLLSGQDGEENTASPDPLLVLHASSELSAHAFRISPRCGRVFLLHLERVRDDYVDFLMEGGGLLREAAMERAGLTDVQAWFFERFEWSDIDRLGVCIQPPPPDEIRSARNAIRATETPSYSSRLHLLHDRIAERDARRLDSCLTACPPSPVSRPRQRM